MLLYRSNNMMDNFRLFGAVTFVWRFTVELVFRPGLDSRVLKEKRNLDKTFLIPSFLFGQTFWCSVNTRSHGSPSDITPPIQ